MQDREHYASRYGEIQSVRSSWDSKASFTFKADNETIDELEMKAWDGNSQGRER
jgi:hypothetical protein